MTERVTALVDRYRTNRNTWIEPGHTKLAVRPELKCVIVMAVEPFSYRGLRLKIENALNPKSE